MFSHTPLVIGITGLPCSGKSTAARLISSGKITNSTFLNIDADVISHDLLKTPKVKTEIYKHFGGAVFSDNQEILRNKLAEIVFSDSNSLNYLESLLHPLIIDRVKCLILDHNGPILIEAALLYKANMHLLCNLVLLISSDLDHRLSRALKRGWDFLELNSRSARQAEFLELALSNLDFWKTTVVANNGDLPLLIHNLQIALKDFIVVKGN